MDFHDPVSSASHLIMAVWAAFAGLILMRLTRNFPSAARWSFAVYMLFTVLLYTASGLYHGLRHDTPEHREFWLRVDRSAIYLMVFGSFMPVFGVCPNVRVRVISFTVMTILCLIGIVFQTTGNVSSLGSIVGYVLIACVGMLTVPWWMRKVGKSGLIWMSLATLLYGLGGAVQAAQWPNPWPGVIGFHELLHLFDVAATLVHFRFVMMAIVRPGRMTAKRYDESFENRNTDPCLPAAITSATT